MILDLSILQQKYTLNIKGVLHIGAHHGKEMEIYEKLNISNVVFFEPVPDTFDMLKSNIKNKAILVNTALGNTIGSAEMFIETVNAGQSSSILEPAGHLRQYPNITFPEKIEVPITKLDTFIRYRGHCNMINVDVQGYELEVFKGGWRFLNHIDYIMTEVNRSELYKSCPMVEDLDGFLQPYGFRRVETDWAGHTWGDAFYIKI